MKILEFYNFNNLDFQYISMVKSIIMVRLFNLDKNNIEKVKDFSYKVMHLQELVTHVAEYNHPENIRPCVYAMWHENQCAAYGLADKKNVNILISNSKDGQVISYVMEKFGFQVCRGSSNRKGAVSGTLKMISQLKDGQAVAIMVDGPRGPLHKVKSGAVMVAREANVPIIPVHWYSDMFNFIRVPSWDKMTVPVGPCWLLNLYGEPIYTEGKTDDEVKAELAKSLEDLRAIAPEKFKEAKKLKLWKKQNR